LLAEEVKRLGEISPLRADKGVGSTVEITIYGNGHLLWSKPVGWAKAQHLQ
jgi:hypothetical protein